MTMAALANAKQPELLPGYGQHCTDCVSESDLEAAAYITLAGRMVVSLGRQILL